MVEAVDVAIVGAGPAGIAAAIQLKRYGIEPLVLEKGIIGGLLNNANLVENYPGFPKGVSGIKLAKLFRRQLELLNIQVNREEVISIDYYNDRFIINTTRGNYRSGILLLASGTKPRKGTLPVAGKDNETGVLYEITSVLGVRDARFAIIGAGDAAFDYALNLSKYNQVSINNRGSAISCLPLLRKRIINNSNITYRENCSLTHIKNTLDCLEICWRNNGKEITESVDYLVYAIGRIPNLDFLTESTGANLDKLQRKGVLFTAGDMRNGRYRQASIAVGDGVRAAMKIERKLNEFII